jgi:asparagine synthase (glutamine-hydrolysing)
MCGIAGFLGRGDETVLRRMLDLVAHRGPDAEGIHVEARAGLGLGHRRLSVVDIETGQQPMWTADDRLGVVFNGEIYNHEELRKELESRGHAFRSDHSDTEVLLHGYREWGPALVPRLEGMWALALYDRRRRRLFLSRDRFGQKPLYYTQQNGCFVFASELDALAAHPAVTTGTSREALQKYFAYGFIPSPHSLLERVWKLPGGCNLEVDARDGVPREARYWAFRLAPDPDAHSPSLGEWAELLRERLTQAVHRRLVADVPVGVLLSGGIDSSAIAALAARSRPDIATFSIGFDDPSFDESAHAAAVAERLGTRHRSTPFGVEAAREALQSLAARLDEPIADASLGPTWLLCREARRDVTVALGGDGADELFAGYDPFRALHFARVWSRCVPRPVHWAIRLLAGGLPTSHRNMSLDFKIKRTLRGLSYDRRVWNPVWLGPLEPPEIARLFGESVRIESVYREAIETWERCTSSDLVDRTLEFYTRLYLENDILAKVDRASMLHGLEVRSPFLDTGVVDVATRLPAVFKFHRGRGKRVLREALRDVLPAAVLDRPKKGFGIPIGRWLREGALPVDASPACGLSIDFHRRRTDAHRRGRADHRLYLFAQWLLSERVRRIGA